MNERKESKLMQLINKVGGVLLINLAFLVCCLPIVTIGPAWSGLYGAVRYMIRQEDWFDGFKMGFKKRFLRNLVGTVVGLLVSYYMLDNLLAAAAMLGDGVEVTMAVIMVVFAGVILLGALLFITVMVLVNMYIPTEMNQWLENTWYLIFHAPLQSLAAVVLVWFPVAQLVFFPSDVLVFAMVYVAAYFAMAGFAVTILLKKPLIRLLEREREAQRIIEE